MSSAESKQTSEAKEKVTKIGKKLVADIEKGTNPNMEISIRSLSNISFDRKAKTLVLGDKKAKRFFFNVGHVRKFAQT
ncbi:MAG: DNA topoisomerase IV subunit A, partial [Nanoarchaeota archaeon]